ncbi:MAG TPA: class I SAM-dependent methyltransferase [Gemmatimonadaceae bacterium]|nr:class I SAM-dependent methyltransferase [Gemmatimonadaceae bacterium]
MSDWFKQWFGKEYLELYPHRDEHEAQAAVQLVRNTIHGTNIGPALDLACGTGRHSRALREWLWTAGLDLSMALLGVAATESPGAPYVRGDMRSLPFVDHAFGLVVNFFTSFGYFDTDAQHLRVLAEVARVTRPGGTFVLDYFNADEVRRTLVPFTERVVDGRTIRQRRHITPDGRYVEKIITADGCDQTYQERVRLFTPDELRMMLEESGFAIAHEYGTYNGDTWNNTSPRIILFAERE